MRLSIGGSTRSFDVDDDNPNRALSGRYRIAYEVEEGNQKKDENKNLVDLINEFGDEETGLAHVEDPTFFQILGVREFPVGTENVRVRERKKFTDYKVVQLFFMIIALGGSAALGALVVLFFSG